MRNAATAIAFGLSVAYAMADCECLCTDGLFQSIYDNPTEQLAYANAVLIPERRRASGPRCDIASVGPGIRRLSAYCTALDSDRDRYG